MREEAPESFNFEQFKIELSELVEEYASASYQTYDNDHIKEKEIAQKKATELYNKLLKLCSNALKKQKNKKEIMEEIDKKVVWYQHKNGFLLFGPNTQIDFYRELALKVAEA